MTFDLEKMKNIAKKMGSTANASQVDEKLKKDLSSLKRDHKKLR